MSLLLRLALGLLLLSLPARAATPAAALEAELRAIEIESGGMLGVKVVHLETGTAAGWNASVPFPMASVYKLPIGAVVLARVEGGYLRLDQEVEVFPGELRRTGSRVDPWRPGTSVPVRRLLDAMLTESDNTACDVLLRVVGGGRAVDAWLEAHGFAEIDVTFSELRMNALAAGVAPLPTDALCDHACLDARIAGVPKETRAAAERDFEADRRNTASPDDLGRFLVELRKGSLLSVESTRTLLGMMRRNRTGSARIRALLPKGTAVWDRTGSIGRSANAVGLVELPEGKGTLAVVVLVKGSTKGWPERERAIARVAKAAFDAFVR